MIDLLSVPRAVAAAVAVARAHGVVCDEPEVVKHGANVIVHLAPAPVVARIASTTAVVRPRPEAFLARDIAVARFAYDRGAAVVPPAGELPPGPHRHDGRFLTFWRYVEHERGATAAPRPLGAALAELHAVLAAYDLSTGEPLPYVGPVLGELPDVFGALGAAGVVAPDELARWQERLVACSAALPPPGGPGEQALHGDAHRRNVLMTRAGLVWTDFEDSCRANIAWDLACMRNSGPEALAAYGDRPSDAELAPFLTARALQSEVWERIFAARDQGLLPGRGPGSA
jgi:Phosphotransferase enzyme family